MTIETQITEYINIQSEPKRSEMLKLHSIILELKPECKLWFLDGVNDENKTVSNPNIGYGFQNLAYANGRTREFYQIGMSANNTGISIYIIGLNDKNYLPKTCENKIGKAKVSSYCIKFKSLKDINLDVLNEAILFGFGIQI